MLKEDVLAFLESGRSDTKPAAAAPPASQPSSEKATPAAAAAAAAPRPPPQPAPEALTEDVVEPITGIRSSMVKSMTAALKVPHFGYADEVSQAATAQAGRREERREGRKAGRKAGAQCCGHVRVAGETGPPWLLRVFSPQSLPRARSAAHAVPSLRLRWTRSWPCARSSRPRRTPWASN